MMSINQATTGTQLYCKMEEVLSVQNQMFTIALLLISDTFTEQFEACSSGSTVGR